MKHSEAKAAHAVKELDSGRADRLPVRRVVELMELAGRDSAVLTVGGVQYTITKGK